MDVYALRRIIILAVAYWIHFHIDFVAVKRGMATSIDSLKSNLNSRCTITALQTFDYAALMMVFVLQSLYCGRVPCCVQVWICVFMVCKYIVSTLLLFAYFSVYVNSSLGSYHLLRLYVLECVAELSLLLVKLRT